MLRNVALALMMSVGFASGSAFAADVGGKEVPYESPSEGAGVKSGILRCETVGSENYIIVSSYPIVCVYKPFGHGPLQGYTGSIDSFGIDLGPIETSRLEWVVFAPALETKPGSLAGYYGGVTAGFSLGGGFKTNVLLGGVGNSFSLQPLSFSGQTGFNISAGVSSLTLEPASLVIVQELMEIESES